MRKKPGRSPGVSPAANYSATASFSITTFKCAVTSLCSFTGHGELAHGFQRFVQLDLYGGRR